MAQLTHKQYDALERAVVMGTRVVIQRSGRRQSVIIPLSLQLRDGREALSAIHPTTGDDLTIYLDEIDSIEVVG